MLTSLAYIFIIGITLGLILEKIHLPPLLGMLITGVVIGPCVLNLLDDSILLISPDLRTLALVVILIKAGLSLNLQDLKKVGRPAILMSFVPASFEILAITFLAPLFLDVTYTEALIIGSVLAAVSPAVVVPKMVQLMESGYGVKKGIPHLILAGASVDDVFVIVLFTTFIGIESSGSFQGLSLLNVPVSIVVGILIGCILGIALVFIFKKIHLRDSVKVLILLGSAFILLALEGYVTMSALLGVMVMAILIQVKLPEAGVRLSSKFGKIWVFAQVVLFVLVGSAVDISYVSQAGLGAVAVILLALCVRSFGVWLCLLGTKLNSKERLFTIIAYLPKATVQASIGGIPLAMGLECGQTVLTMAVLGILITAPIGAVGMELTYKKLLEKN